MKYIQHEFSLYSTWPCFIMEMMIPKMKKCCHSRKRDWYVFVLRHQEGTLWCNAVLAIYPSSDHAAFGPVRTRKLYTREVESGSQLTLFLSSRDHGEISQYNVHGSSRNPSWNIERTSSWRGHNAYWCSFGARCVFTDTESNLGG